MSSTRCVDTFSIALVLDVTQIDAEIEFQNSRVTPRDYYQTLYDYVVNFTYVSGIPAASHFSFNSPDGLRDFTYTFNPSMPEGEGSEVRHATLTGTISQEAHHTDITFSGQITIHQAIDDIVLQAVSNFRHTIDTIQNIITVLWNLPTTPSSDVEGESLSLEEVRARTTATSDTGQTASTVLTTPVTPTTQPGETQQLVIDYDFIESLFPQLETGQGVEVVVEVEPVYEADNTYRDAVWRYDNTTGQIIIESQNGDEIAALNYPNDAQWTSAGAVILTGSDGVKYKVPPIGVTASLQQHGSVSKNSWRFPLSGRRPTAPYPLVLNNYAPNSVRMTWDKPYDNGSVALTRYNFRYYRKGTLLPTVMWHEPDDGPLALSVEINIGLETPGTYIFEVRAQNGTNRWSPRTTEEIILAPT